MEWLKTSQDGSKDSGISAYFDLLKHSWAYSYPETTGYIIPTFLAYADTSQKYEFEERAIRMGDWEIAVQLPSGACRAGDVRNRFPRVFNTGQVILGWCSLFRRTSDPKYLRAAVDASSWLVRVQDDDGKWTRHTYQGPRTYHARVSWALLETYALSERKVFLKAAQKNLSWVLSQQTDNGWFRNTSLSDPNSPWTHLIAYTVQGLLESHRLLSNSALSTNVYAGAKRAASKLRTVYAASSFLLPSSLDARWKSSDLYSCLTGDAQIAVVWLKLHATSGDSTYRKAALRMIGELKTIQRADHRDPALRGGIPGSYPVDGAYARYKLLSWATKFFADALLLKANSRLVLGG
ncbi:MAG: hypothetical protein A2900_03415 [Candidatus Chisholmbacteria bacterium RIFCSPLOWO2_01_FULL_50_28]|uniref:Squalene cyclase C-terminal domain-containing protein n=1 Tax=Candidatus Chisholmbacteria bacterium RIFCSPHIGHO2_01_FULL_52_32 TaxID=1797591 RepID=A0A1G1VU54_9BACT|nr:MAG: hypothetical protein A2786_03330 [Candidatus Chisholmbacteria bacterium RIFCSPHIGHO2_01_FULL_52_32]OGY20628.1 MAG: hypothetical protein A2900_03415 [Candidatus Chisholmbacteria bacterium RIFCSPLOWO2_01_FULL_50_28]